MRLGQTWLVDKEWKSKIHEVQRGNALSHYWGTLNHIKGEFHQFHLYKCVDESLSQTCLHRAVTAQEKLCTH